MHQKSRLWIIELVVVLLAVIFFRFYHLDSSPPGFHYDEAYNGLDSYALTMQSLGEWPIFFNNNFGREPLLIYLLAIVQTLAFPAPIVLRSVMAFIGALLSVGLFWLGWELGLALKINHHRFALWSALVPLTILWSQIFSRYVIRAELFAFLLVLFWAALWHAWRQGGWLTWMLAGIFGGLTFYTYIPSRLIPFMLAPFLVWAYWRSKSRIVKDAPKLIIAALTALIIALPLMWYFWNNPVAFWTRTDQVNMFQQGAYAILHNVVAVIKMAFLEGDQNIRNNIPGRPVLDPVMTIPFLLGLAALVRRWRQPAAIFLGVWWGTMLTPTILSDFAPNFSRAIGAMPVFVLIVALGLERTTSWLTLRFPSRPHWAWAAGLGLVGIGSALTWHAFFLQWSPSPLLFYARDVGFLQLSPLVEQYAAENMRVYISPRGKNHPTLQYARLSTTGRWPSPLQGFDGRVCVRVSSKTSAAYLFILPEDFRGPDLLASYLPQSSASIVIRDRENKPWALARIQKEDGQVQFPEMTPYPVVLDDGIELLGYWLSQSELTPADRLYVRLFWKAKHSPQKDYTAFVHLITDDGQSQSMVAGADGKPGNGSCATTTWLPGEVVVDEKELVVPAKAGQNASATYFLEIGFYVLETGERLSIPEHPDNRILIGPLFTYP